MAVAKSRLDLLLVARGMAETQSKAQALIMSGVVFSGERKLTAAGEQVPDDTVVDVRGREHPWVSRGGMKLARGLTHFGFDVKDRVCVDVGSSTGGFTDVLLHHGAAKVYAVDVGYGQLADKLRKNPRVVVLERTNARHLTAKEIPEALDAVVCDASFIGLRTVLPASLMLTKPGAVLIALIKPQFEVGKDRVGKGGVVRDPALHAEVCDMVSTWLAEQPGWQVRGVTPSPITGPEGNVEFLIGAVREPAAD
jgi:23S rRNA (cytidine1920-2'-O)/16S rRNA (cytidine1409-2'-O)-methyltransferase